MFNLNTGVFTGTSGAKFTVAKQMTAGVVGYRDLGNGSFRVRVEANSSAAGQRLSNPGGGFARSGSEIQPAFSAVVTASSVANYVVLAAKALKAAVVVPVASSVAAALSAAGF